MFFHSYKLIRIKFYSERAFLFQTAQCMLYNDYYVKLVSAYLSLSFMRGNL